MNVQTILAAKLNLDFDYNLIKKEILNTREYWTNTPPYDFNINAAKSGKIFMSETLENYELSDYISPYLIHTKKKLQGADIFYMRYHKNNMNKTQRFDVTKNLPAEGWAWRDEVVKKTPYFKTCIESLPYEHVGCIRVFILENTFFATHRDYGWGKEQTSSDYDACFGLSIIPDTGDVPMKIYSFAHKKVYEVPGNAMLFNDSAWHGVGIVSGIRITIRIFGKIDYQYFLPYIDNKSLFVD